MPNAKNMGLKAPFPYFGGKSRIIPVVWSYFGNVNNLLDPFCGSCALILLRPVWHLYQQNCIETVNDLDGMICNFWRAVQYKPQETAKFADWPQNEIDLYARHQVLIARKPELREQLEADPQYCDPEIAAWWVWGISQWIGGGWCVDHGRGVHRVQQIGCGRNKGINRTEGRRLHLGRDYELQSKGYNVYEDFHRLSERFRHVRVLSGDWTRITSHTATDYHHGMTGMFLDPPYPHAQRNNKLYAEDHDFFEAVWEYAMQKGTSLKMRIAVCGYDDGRKPAKGWTTYRWKTAGGMARLGKGRGQENRSREVIWFSPHCLKQEQGKLFGEG